MMEAMLVLAVLLSGTGDYEIIQSKEASPTEQWAVEDLAAHLEQMTGDEFPVRTEGDALPAKAILVGDGPAVRGLGVTVDHDALGRDGFILKTVGDRLVIAGGRKRGTMYGVYEWLSRLGCRWWAPGESTIPKLEKLEIEPLEVKKVPALEYRDMLYGDLWIGDRDSENAEQRKLWREARLWCARNHVHAAYHEMPEDLGPIAMDHAIAHGVLRFLPKEKYFEEHPEFYALSRGKRTTRQPCWSNEEGIRTAARHVIEMLDEHPEWRLITLGQEDNSTPCQCEKCQALVEEHGANSAMVLYFVNHVADIVREKHPDVRLNTNAYRWTQSAPKAMTCRDNVMITIPPIACNYSVPLKEGWPEENATYKKDLEDWGKLCDKIYVWDYTTNFVHYAQPWSNFHVLLPNIRFFIDNNVRGIFNQGSHTTDNGQFSKMVMWMLARGMWNPEADGRKLMEEFCLGYYGPEAAPLILEYIDMLITKVTEDRIPIWATHRTHLSARYLTPEIIARAEELFRRAEARVADDPERLRRVRVAHFPVWYMLLRRRYAFWDAAKERCPELSWSEVCRDFARVGRDAGITRVREGDHAEELFRWAEDVAEYGEAFLETVLPEELRDVDPSRVTFVEAAQFDGQVKFMTPVDGATDGWGQRIITHGWSITNRLQTPKDFTPGKHYRAFVRVMGKAKPGAEGDAMVCGIHNPGRPRTASTKMDAAMMDGMWRVVDVGPWNPDDSGGTFYMAWHPDATKTGMFRPGEGPDGKPLPPQSFIDCMWLVEQESGGESE